MAARFSALGGHSADVAHSRPLVAAGRPGPWRRPVLELGPTGLSRRCEPGHSQGLLEQFGGFRPDVQRVQDSVGSMEDHELQIRFWKAGRHGLYVPDLVVMSDVSVNRLMKKSHRRWHLGHGHFYAMARLEEWEHSSVGWLFGVSSHIYKRAVVEAFRWLGCVARGNLHGAFTHETNLCSLPGSSALVTGRWPRPATAAIGPSWAGSSEPWCGG